MVLEQKLRFATENIEHLRFLCAPRPRSRINNSTPQDNIKISDTTLGPMFTALQSRANHGAQSHHARVSPVAPEVLYSVSRGKLSADVSYQCL